MTNINIEVISTPSNYVMEGGKINTTRAHTPCLASPDEGRGRAALLFGGAALF
jgi:hypothetical protein